MDKTLAERGFLSKFRTIHEYMDPGGQLPYIVHRAIVPGRRPDRPAADPTEDDGTAKIDHNGTLAMIHRVNLATSASIPVEGDLDADAQGGVRPAGAAFPRADFLVDAPAKTFLTRITSGYEINTGPVG
jgi:hypothetical protein